MARKKKFIQGAIKHPGRVKNAAKRDGISVHEEAERMAHSPNKSARGAGALALRFEKGGDLHSRPKHKRRGSRKSRTR